VQADNTSAALADTAGQDAPVPGPERHRAVQRALADALQLARLQIHVLVRLDDADKAGDDEAVLNCHVELDHIMARIAGAEQVRTGARATAAGENELSCAGCGAAAEPVYDRPRLLGYRCPYCGWEGEDPAAQAERKRAEALDAAAAAVGRAAGLIGDTVAVLGHRGKQARAEGVSTLRGLQAELAVIDRRLRKTR
jgi:hypothetical protein